MKLKKLIKLLKKYEKIYGEWQVDIDGEWQVDIDGDGTRDFEVYPVENDGFIIKIR